MCCWLYSTPDVCMLLLMYGVDSSLQSHNGLTALDMAACKGHDDIVDLIHAIELSQSSSTSPVLTATEIATNVDNKVKACIKQWRKCSLKKQSLSFPLSTTKLKNFFHINTNKNYNDFPFNSTFFLFFGINCSL